MSHFAKIKQWIPEEEWIEFQERMEDCVEDETAWCTENTFLYYTKIDRRMSHGVALFGYEFTEELLSMFIGVFTKEDQETCMMRFKLHQGKLIEEYRSMLTLTSIKRNRRSPEHPLMIRVDDFRKKIDHIAKSLVA